MSGLSRFYWWHNTKKVSTVNNVIYFWFLSNLKPLQKTYKFKKIGSRTWTLTWSWAQRNWTWLLSDLLPVWLQSFHVIMCKGTRDVEGTCGQSCTTHYPLTMPIWKRPIPSLHSVLCVLCEWVQRRIHASRKRHCNVVISDNSHTRNTRRYVV